MKKFFIFLLMAFVSLNSLSLLSQNDEEEPTFYIFSKFPVNVVHLYDFTEETEVTRTYSDSSEISYGRYLNFDISLRAPSAPEEGFQDVVASIDSLVYKFYDGRDSVSYNSQQTDGIPPFNIFDYVQNSVALGKEYELSYNPYYEVIDVKGEKLEFDRKYYSDPKTGIKDSVKRFVWLNKLSNSHLSFMADVRKGFFPDFKAPEDTSWKTEVYLELDGIPLRDSVKIHFKEYNVRNYHLDGESIGVIPVKTNAVVHRIKDLSKVLDAEGDISYEIKVSPRGTINLVKINADVTFTMKIKKETYTHHVKTVYTWELGKMYKW